MRAKVTMKAMKMKDGPGFKVSLVVTLQAKRTSVGCTNYSWAIDKIALTLAKEQTRAS